jgi:hypothetical protein
VLVAGEMATKRAAELSRSDWALLALAAAGPAGLSPAQIQKVLFLLSRKIPKQVGRGFYQFRPHNYGPFSVDVYLDAELLERQGHVAILNPGHTWARRYVVTDSGDALARKARSSLPPQVADYLQRVVDWARYQSFQQLVRAIYTAYPEQRENSVFQD